MRVRLTFHLSAYITVNSMIDPIYKQIGAVIKSRRKTLEMKQETLAGLLGISRGSLANVETGRQGVLVHQLYKFAVALQLNTPADLLPQPSPDNLRTERTERTELPLPSGLKAQEKKQITRFFEQVETKQIQERKGKRAKSKSR
jgi:transcriptional regulator with XRE-family HTH domain